MTPAQRAAGYRQRAEQFDADADDFESQSRMEMPDDRQPEA